MTRTGVTAWEKLRGYSTETPRSFMNQIMSETAPRSTRRTMEGGRAEMALLPRGASGRALCRWCAIEVPKGRRTFCCAACVHMWRLRTSTAYMRQQVLLRDRGICARCTVNTLEAYLLIRRARGARRRQLLGVWGLKKLDRKSLWDADHIVPVVEGGGECDLLNLRTLCVHCHRIVTGALRARRESARSRAAAALVG